MTTVILVKKGDQVQQKIERGVHKFIGTDSLSPIPERQKKREEGTGIIMNFYAICNFRIAFEKCQNLLKSLGEVN